MSRGQLARTPENFPRMKHRAAARVAAHELDRTWAAFNAWAKAVADAAAPFVKALQDMAARVTTFLRRHFRIERDVLYVRDEVGARWTAAMVRHHDGTWAMLQPQLVHHVTDEDLERWGDEASAFRRAQAVATQRRVVERQTFEPWHHDFTAPPIPKTVDYGAPGMMRVPHVDADIVAHVDAMNPTSLGQRVAMERTLQDRRDHR